MRKSGWFFWVAGWVLLYPTTTLSSSPAESTNGVQVQAIVEKEEGGVFVYSYSIRNDLTDLLYLNKFDLGVLLPTGAVAPPAGRLEEKEWKNRGYTDILSLSKIPIRLLAPNRRWLSHASLGFAFWQSRSLLDDPPEMKTPPLNQIAPGATFNGFMLASTGLPGIRPFRINPTDGPPVPEGEQRGPHFYGKTIGPIAILDQTSPLRFSAYLKDLILQAESLGWIEGPRIIRELTGDLDQVREDILSNDVEPALIGLAASLEKIKDLFEKNSTHQKNGQDVAEEEAFLSPEGIALIRFNTEHLLNLLKDLKKTEGTKHRKSLQDTKIKANVSLEGARMFHYSYAVTNGIRSEAGISLFSIDLAPSLKGMRLNGNGFPPNSFSPEVFHPGKDQPIPVGAFTPKDFMPLHEFLYPRMTWGYAADQIAPGFGDTFLEEIGRPDGISPGETLRGFELFSHGLPGIRDYYLVPSFVKPRPPFSGTVIQPDVTDIYARNYYNFVENTSVKGRTIGPTAPPEKLIPLLYLFYLSDLKRQAQALGWLTGAGFIDELDRMLREIKERIQTDNSSGAVRELNSFIVSVETSYQNGEEITSEGWALLKFNAEYLRDQISKPKTSEDSPDILK